MRKETHFSRACINISSFQAQYTEEEERKIVDANLGDFVRNVNRETGKSKYKTNLGHFGPIPCPSGCFALGCFSPISGMGCFGPKGVCCFGLISKVGHFSPTLGMNHFGLIYLSDHFHLIMFAFGKNSFSFS